MRNGSEKEIPNRNKILFSFGKKQKAIARSIVIHPDLNLMFVQDRYNQAIQVYTQSGDHVTTHVPKAMWEYDSFLWGSAYKYGTLYVTDTINDRILRFNDFSVTCHSKWRNGQITLNSPRGLSCDEDSNVYVADKNNHRICVFDYELKLINIIAEREIAKPRDVQVVWGELAVLTEDAPFLIVFTLEGEVLRTVDKLISHCLEPWFFYIDEDWNIFISDYDAYSVSAFTETGELKGKLFDRFEGTSVFGVSLTAEKRVIVSTSNFENPFHIIKRQF